MKIVTISVSCRFIVITGGEYPRKSTTELLDVSQPNPQWRVVEQLSLPVPMSRLKGVTLGEEFVISGGRQDSGLESSQIFRLLCNKGQCEIQKMTQTLQVARCDHVFLPLPASLANC